MTSNSIQFKGIIYLEDTNIHVFENGDRSITTHKVFYENASVPFDLEAEMEADRKKYEAMKWYNKTFCNARD